MIVLTGMLWTREISVTWSRTRVTRSTGLWKPKPLIKTDPALKLMNTHTLTVDLIRVLQISDICMCLCTWACWVEEIHLRRCLVWIASVPGHGDLSPHLHTETLLLLGLLLIQDSAAGRDREKLAKTSVLFLAILYIYFMIRLTFGLDYPGYWLWWIFFFFSISVFSYIVL